MFVVHQTMNGPGLPRYQCTIVFVTMVYLICQSASADQITLNTGDVLIGTVTQRTDEQVKMDHPLLGPVVIAADKIASVTE